MGRTEAFAALSLALSGLPATLAGQDAINSPCMERRISASAVQTREDVRAFVHCAAEYIREHGTAKAHLAFHVDERWRHGPLYVFVNEVAPQPDKTLALVHPPDPSKEGKVWGNLEDSFGRNLFADLYRMLAVVDAGWFYYPFLNPATGRQEPKASYVIEIEWNGIRAAVGAGIYEGDLPGTCHPERVNAALLDSAPSPRRLQEFVRCAALRLESDAHLATEELVSGKRWNNGSIYLYVLDTAGNQVFSGKRAGVDGVPFHEWGSRASATERFGGRDTARVGEVFGEAFVYYAAENPASSTVEPKFGMIKRVTSYGVPLLVGAGYHSPDPAPVKAPCSQNSASAAAVREREDLEAFVQCAAEYASRHGTAAARRAFNDGTRWKEGSIYVFVTELAPSLQKPAELIVFPPDPSREGSAPEWSHDEFGTTIPDEMHRVLSLVDSGWIYYSFANPETGMVEPKSSFAKVIDWNGRRAAIGAGIYERDLPGTCDRSQVNAAIVSASQAEGPTVEFVNCAALALESIGLYAPRILSSEPQWSSDLAFLVAVNPESGRQLFNGSPNLFDEGMSAQQFATTALGGMDVPQLVNTFGEVFLYFDFPVAGHATGPVAAYLRRVVVQGAPILLGAGYSADATAP